MLVDRIGRVVRGRCLLVAQWRARYETERQRAKQLRKLLKIKGRRLRPAEAVDALNLINRYVTPTEVEKIHGGYPVRRFKPKGPPDR